jgi:hypothetical protein
LILLAGKDGHGHRNRDALGVEEATLVFPIEARRRDPGVGQPIQRDVVQDLVAGQVADGLSVDEGAHRGRIWQVAGLERV